jgi:signal transduction histidine kinase
LSDQLNRMEEMLATLIKMQATNNAKIEELSEEMKEVKVELKEEIKEVRETLHTFRSETSMYLKKIERHMKLIEEDLDRTMVTVESMQTNN